MFYMRRTMTIVFMFLASFTVFACMNTREQKNAEISKDDETYLQVVDSALLSTMNFQEKQKAIMVYKLAEHIELHVKDSVYTLAISEEEAKKLGVDKKTYDETVASIAEVNRNIADYNHSHEPNHSLELTDFKQLIKERKLAR